MKKTFSVNLVFLCLVFVGFLYTLFFYSVHQLQKSGNERVIAKQSDISVAKLLRNLPFSSFLVNESELDLVLAYHTLHQDVSDYRSLMSNGTEALQMYREVEGRRQENNLKYAKYALLEICNTLFRMPWNDQLKELAHAYATKLNASLLERTIDPDDQASAHENLAIFFFRMNSPNQAKLHASIADSIDEKQFEPAIANGFNFLRSIRTALARCIAGESADIELSRKQNTDNSVALTTDFFRNQHYHFWDVALLETAKFSSKENSCRSVIENYQYLL